MRADVSPASGDEGEGTTSAARNILYVIIILVSCVLIYFFAYRNMRFFKVPSASMEPTLRPHDYLLTLNHENYYRGDIVVFKDPTLEGGYLVKRIVGVGRDRVAVEGGALLINESYVSEPYVNELMDYRLPGVRVPEGHLFMLGDNRNNSDDGHSWNPKDRAHPVDKFVSEDTVVGKVHFVYLPFSRAQKVLAYPLENVRGDVKPIRRDRY